jgi:hypothetical protein
MMCVGRKFVKGGLWSWEDPLTSKARRSLARLGRCQPLQEAFPHQDCLLSRINFIISDHVRYRGECWLDKGLVSCFDRNDVFVVRDANSRSNLGQSHAQHLLCNE